MSLRIAHFSDVHLLEPKTGFYGFSVNFVSAHRRLDPRGRAEKMRSALATAKASAANRIVISGDLTETGDPSQFEHFAELLHESGIAADAVTLVPGNHDAYGGPGAWTAALDGPLRAFARSSARAPGHVVVDGDVAILPLDVTCQQSIVYAGGEFTEANAAALERRLDDSALRNKALVIVQHHPPFAPPRSLMRWFDGLRGYARLLHLLGKHANVHLLHGHTHALLDRIVGGIGKSRIFGAPGTVDDRPRHARVRLYEVQADGLVSLGLASPAPSGPPISRAA